MAKMPSIRKIHHFQQIHFAVAARILGSFALQPIQGLQNFADWIGLFHIGNIENLAKLFIRFALDFLQKFLVLGLEKWQSQTSILDAVQEIGKYTTKDSVAAYIHKFQKLPSNYVNKATGQALYETQTGNTWTKWNFNPWQILGVMIGGDYFGNNEGLLPTGNYKECDVDYHDSSRGTKRLVYTNAGLVYYTANHYESFILIYEQ